VSYSGFVNNETYTDLPTQATASTTATSASGVGDYVISVGGAIDNNYSFNYVNGNLRINAVPIVFNPILPQTYGAADLDPGATSNAGITYTSSNTNVATIVSGQIHIKAAGSTLITANNGSSTQSQTLIVNPAPLTVTADNQSKAYGANNPALTVSYSGFVNGDTQNSLTTQATATTTATVASPVGSYPINVTGGAVDPNYTFTYVAGTLTVGKATLTVTADNSSKVYGAANPAFTVSYSGFMNGDTKTNLTTQATVSTSATTASPVGSYDLVPAGAASSNYNFTYVNGTLNVTPAGLLITANNQTKAYGAGIPPFTANFSGFVNGDNSNTALSTQPTLTTTATASSPIGTYPITASGAVAANYTITYAPGTLTVGQANLVITPDPISKVYGAAIPTLTASYSGFANGDTPASLTTQPTLSTTATASSPIGTYLITATGASSPNYNITYNTGNLTVTPATLTITANNLSKTYGTANPTLTVSYSGFVNGETRNNLTTRPTITTTATTTSPAGAYPITASGAVDPNYTFVYVPGTLTVNPAVLTVTAADKAKTYGANNPNLTVTYSGWVNGDTQTSLTTPATATTTATATSPVGDYPITPAGAVNPNYTFNYVGGTLTVGQATLTIAANTMAKTYGSPNPALTVSYSGFVNGDSQANLLGQPIVATTATNSSPVGNYPITASGAYSPNYNINYLQGTMIVTQVALFISADNQTKVAGAANPTLTASYSGFVNGDTQANLTTQPTLSTTATTNSPAGTYPISVSGAVDPNYSIAYASGTMTVTSTPLTFAAIPAKTYGAADFDPGASSASPITYTSSNPAVATIVSGNIHIIGVGNSVITATSGSSSQTQLLIVNPASLTIIANGVTKSYGVALTGGAGSTGTFFPLGLVNGEAIGSVTITYGSGAAASAAVGTYNGSVTASAATGGTFNPNNYSINYVSNNITVQAVALTITANNQAKNYGSANPALTLSYSGFVNGDNQASLSTPPTVSTSAVTNSPVGSYPINVSGAASNNYSISYNNGTLTVGQAALVISADNHAKNYGSVNPALTITYSGFVNGENSANLTTLPTISTTATTSSPIGNYPITVSGAVDGNYSISYTAGTMTVTPAALTITADNQSKVYGSVNPALTISYSGFVNGESQSNLNPLPVASTSATTASGVGSYPITVSGAVNPNYSFIYNAGTLTVTPALLTITANNQTKTQGAANPPLTLSYSGYVNGDNQASLSTPPTVSTTATTNSPVGPYPITVGGASDPDYTFSYVQGTLTVVGNPLAFGPLPSKIYGAGDFNAGATSSNSITYTSSNPAVATIVSGNIHIVGAGSSTITANDGTSSLQQTLNVATAPLTVTANNASKTYGAANPALSVGYSGFVNGDTQANLTAQASASTAATVNSAVGTYAITASGAASNNYSITYNAGTLTVGQASLTITANNQSKTYGAANPSLTVGYSGFVNGDNNTTALTTQATVSTSATVSSPVGSYPISASGAVSANYSISYAQGTLTIGQAALTITADNQSKVQGAANPTLTASYNGFVNGDTQANLTTLPTVTTTATTGSPAGTYPITASGAASANYSMSYVQGTLTVNGSLTFNAIASKVYGAADFNPGATSTGGAITYSSGNTAVATIVSGNIHIVGVGTSTITANNGTSSLQQTLTVTPAALTATANNQSKTYGSANPSLTVSYSGFVNGENSSVVTTLATVTTTATASSAVGSYPITASGANAANYSISYVQGTLTIGQAALTITANNQTMVQGSAVPTLTVNYSGFVNGETNTALTTQPTVSTTATSASAAGTYPITASGAVDANYTISYVAGTMTVTASTPFTFAAIPSKVYGTADFNPGATGSGTITYTSGNTAVATIVSGNIHIVGVGTSTITANNGASSLQQTLTVTRAPLTITANAVNKTYGATLTGGAGSSAFTPTGLVNGQTVGTVTIAYGTGSAANAAVNTYTGSVTPSAATGGTFNANNYTITYTTGNIVVGRAPLTITANAVNKTYGSTLTGGAGSNAFTSTGLVNGQTIGTVTIAYGTGSAAAAAVGTYAGSVTPSAATGGSFNANNYTITYNSGNIVVGTKALTITATAVNKTYGATLTGAAGSTAFTSTGLVTGQTIGSVTMAYGTGSAATAAVGTYAGAATPSAATGGSFTASNYAITYTSGNIVVGRANVMITADNKTKVRGTANPPLTVTYSGFVNGQTNVVLTTQPTVTTNANTNSPVGSYAITASGAVAANYSFTYVQGTLTVTAAAALTFNAIPAQTYGATDFNPGATTGNGTVTYTSGNSAVATIVSGNIHIVGVGTSTITANDGTSSSQQTLTVNPATLTIYAYDINKNYGSPLNNGSGLPYFTPNGLKYGETIGSVTIAFGAAAATNTVVGTYANQVTASAATGGTFKPGCYNITYVQGKIIVNKKVLTITAANKSKAQGTANPALTVTYSGFANGETNSALSTQPSASTTATINSPMGNYPITANGAAANNYSFTYVQGTLTITNPSNASIISVNNPEHVTYVPVEEPVVRQAVSPNGDGINDVLHIDNIESYPDNKVMLMNRNGTTIYEMTGYDNTNKVFDGHSNITKEMQQPGTYFYMVEYKVKGGETKRKTGYFVIKY
jgi:gliding motility-associated-like protein